MASITDAATALLQLAATPEGQNLIREVLDRPDIPQPELEAKIRLLKLADWPDEVQPAKKE